MKSVFAAIFVLASLALLTGASFAGPTPRPSFAPPIMPVEDPKKKKAGEACKTSDECQSHLFCSQNDGKGFCISRPVEYPLPPT